MMRIDPRRARKFVAEDELQATTHWRHERVLPDGLIRHRRKSKDIIIECGGTYSAERLQACHDTCKQWKYEIW